MGYFFPRILTISGCYLQLPCCWDYQKEVRCQTQLPNCHCFLMVLLKVVSATFLLVCFVSLKESTCETRKNAFHFTSKALFVLEIIKFLLFTYSNVMLSSNAQTWKTKDILLNNLGSKHNLIMKFTKENFSSKNFMKNVTWKLILGPF